MLLLHVKYNTTCISWVYWAGLFFDILFEQVSKNSSSGIFTIHGLANSSDGSEWGQAW
jgi:hypothetical protein